MWINRTKILFIFIVVLLSALWTQAQTSSPDVSYRLKSGDKIGIKFLYQPELNETLLSIPPDGNISLQLIDEPIKVEGLTITQLKIKLEKLYNEILLKPVISVNIIEFKPPSVFIGGQVAKPGKYSLADGNTLIQIIFLSGGFTKDASRKMVLYARADENNNWKVTPVNVSDILKNKDGKTDFYLQDGDYIFVPDSKLSKFKNIMESFQSVFPLLRLL